MVCIDNMYFDYTTACVKLQEKNERMSAVKALQGCILQHSIEKFKKEERDYGYDHDTEDFSIRSGS
jgi:hypothetical protein